MNQTFFVNRDISRNFLMLLYLAISLLLPVVAQAECTDQKLIELVSMLHPQSSLDTGFFECKIWPANKSYTLFVAGLPHAAGGDNVELYDVDLFVIDTNTKKVVSHLYQKNAWRSDASILENVKFDTARYQISKNSIAFGISTYHVVKSQIYPYESNTLSLYVLDQGSLRKILDGIITYENAVVGDECGNQSNTKRTLAIASSQTKGYSDIFVRQRIEIDDYRYMQAEHDAGCTEFKDNDPQRPIAGSKTFLLKYGVDSYLVPDETSRIRAEKF